MAHTIQVQGTDEIMAMFGRSGTYYRGKLENVRIIEISNDRNIPIEIRSGLVNLIVPTIFTKESIEEQTGVRFPIFENSRLAYCTDIIEAFKSCGRYKEAEQLKYIAGNSFDMYTLEPYIYELLEPTSSFSMDDFRGGRHPWKKDGGFEHPFRRD